MNIDNRLRESEQNFESKRVERDQHLQLAEECSTKMTKLQGEYRLLQELQLAENDKKVVNKKPATIETVPEQDKK